MLICICRYLWSGCLYLHDWFSLTEQGHPDWNQSPLSKIQTIMEYDATYVMCVSFSSASVFSLKKGPATSTCIMVKPQVMELYHHSGWQSLKNSTRAFQCPQLLYNVKYRSSASTDCIHLISKWQPHCSQKHDHPGYPDALRPTMDAQI